jgi:polyisoprenyl-phosphate glycosyltransferase
MYPPPHFAPSRSSSAQPLLSVVIPLYNEEENVARLWERLRAVLGGMRVSFELLLVDDGSRDATPRLLDALHDQCENIVIVRLSRNFGHQAAVSAGLEHAQGRALVILDGDLQDPPELIPEMVQLWRSGHEVVYAVRRTRREGPVKRLAYRAFYRVLGRISEIDIPLDSGDCCLMDRRVVDALNRLPERCRFIRGLRSYVGFRQVGLEYDRPAREAGRPKYTLRKLSRLAIDGLVSFSGTPLRIVTYLGAITAALALILTGWVIDDAIRNQTAPRGWASTTIVILFMGAIQLLSLGVIGEYIRLIFLECKGRPSYIIDELKRHQATITEIEAFPHQQERASSKSGPHHGDVRS